MLTRVWRRRTLLIGVAILLQLALIPVFARPHQVTAQTGGSTGTTTTTGTTPTNPGNVSIAEVVICGTVTAFTAPTSTTGGSVTIAGITFQIAPGATIVGNFPLLVLNHTNACMVASFNSAGQIVAATVSVNNTATNTLDICGTVSAFTAATATVAGSITIGGLVFPIAPGTSLSGGSLTIGTSYCFQITLVNGQISAGTVSTSVPLSASLPDRSGYLREHNYR